MGKTFTYCLISLLLWQLKLLNVLRDNQGLGFQKPELKHLILMLYVLALLSTHSERSSKPISLHKHIHPNLCFSQSLSMVLTTAMSQVNGYSALLFFCLVHLESVFRWRLSANSYSNNIL